MLTFNRSDPLHTPQDLDVPPTFPLIHLGRFGHVSLDEGCHHVFQDTNDILQRNTQACRMAGKTRHLQPFYETFFLCEVDGGFRYGSDGLEALYDERAQIVVGRRLEDGRQQRERMSSFANLPVLQYMQPVMSDGTIRRRSCETRYSRSATS
jgi:hypothetical protein